jgi:hypothetical protein
VKGPINHSAAVIYACRRLHGYRPGITACAVQDRGHHVELRRRGRTCAGVFVTFGEADGDGGFEYPKPGAADLIAYALTRNGRFIELWTRVGSSCLPPPRR